MKVKMKAVSRLDFQVQLTVHAPAGYDSKMLGDCSHWACQFVIIQRCSCTPRLHLPNLTGNCMVLHYYHTVGLSSVLNYCCCNSTLYPQEMNPVLRFWCFKLWTVWLDVSDFNLNLSVLCYTYSTQWDEPFSAWADRNIVWLYLEQHIQSWRCGWWRRRQSECCSAFPSACGGRAAAEPAAGPLEWQAQWCRRWPPTTPSLQD